MLYFTSLWLSVTSNFYFLIPWSFSPIPPIPLPVFNLANPKPLTLPHSLLSMETTAKTLAFAFLLLPLFPDLLGLPYVVPWYSTVPLLENCEYTNLCFWWLLSPNLLGSPYLHTQKSTFKNIGESFSLVSWLTLPGMLALLSWVCLCWALRVWSQLWLQLGFLQPIWDKSS